MSQIWIPWASSWVHMGLEQADAAGPMLVRCAASRLPFAPCAPRHICIAVIEDRCPGTRFCGASLRDAPQNLAPPQSPHAQPLRGLAAAPPPLLRLRYLRRRVSRAVASDSVLPSGPTGRLTKPRPRPPWGCAARSPIPRLGRCVSLYRRPTRPDPGPHSATFPEP